MFKERFDRVKKYVKEHKVEIAVGTVFTGFTVGLGLIIRKAMSYDITDTDWLTEHPDEIQVDGEWIPMRDENGAYYADVFADDLVRDEFIDMGYRVVERE